MSHGAARAIRPVRLADVGQGRVPHRHGGPAGQLVRTAARDPSRRSPGSGLVQQHTANARGVDYKPLRGSAVAALRVPQHDVARAITLP